MLIHSNKIILEVIDAKYQVNYRYLRLLMSPQQSNIIIKTGEKEMISIVSDPIKGKKLENDMDKIRNFGQNICVPYKPYITSCMFILANYMENNEWELLRTQAIRNEVKYSCCPQAYPDVTFHIYLARRSLFYVLNLVFPIAVITLLTTLSFVLPAESGRIY